MPAKKKPHHTIVSAKHTELTTEQQKLLASYGFHTEAEMKSYLRPAEGLARVWPMVVSFLNANPAIGQALNIDSHALQREVDEAAALDGPTQTAYALYRRGMENALAKRSDVVRAVYKINRMVQNAENPELVRAFEKVSEWVSDTHAHNTHPPTDGDHATPPTVAPSTAANA